MICFFQKATQNFLAEITHERYLYSSAMKKRFRRIVFFKKKFFFDRTTLLGITLEQLTFHFLKLWWRVILFCNVVTTGRTQNLAATAFKKKEITTSAVTVKSYPTLFKNAETYPHYWHYGAICDGCDIFAYLNQHVTRAMWVHIKEHIYLYICLGTHTCMCEAFHSASILCIYKSNKVGQAKRYMPLSLELLTRLCSHFKSEWIFWR